MILKNNFPKKCYNEDCKWRNRDNTCSFSECSYEPEDEWDGDIPGQYMQNY